MSDSSVGRRSGIGSRLLAVAVGATMILAACSSSTVSPAASSGGGAPASVQPFSGTMHIASSTWTGYAGLYIAASKGFWKNHGLTVDFTDVEDPVQRLNALNGGQLDGMASTVDAFTRASAQNVPLAIVFPMDASVGGDGILAKDTIATVADLKGKTIAVNIGSVSEWFLAQVLAKNGLSEKDVTLLNMTSGDAGAAFVAGKVDVAVTWEPWLTRAAATPGGKVLVSSKAYPNLIVDAFVFRRDFIAQHPDAVTNFMAGYYDAINYWTQNTTDANGILKTAMKYDTVAAVATDLTGIKLYSLAEAKTMFGTTASHGPIYDSVKAASDFWKAKGDTTADANVDQTVDPSFIAAAK
jgi:NitT/TauT family transport system substrate-binding protein